MLLTAASTMLDLFFDGVRGVSGRFHADEQIVCALRGRKSDALSELALARKASAIWVPWRGTLDREEIG